jgi:hypothetical protein
VGSERRTSLATDMIGHQVTPGRALTLWRIVQDATYLDPSGHWTALGRIGRSLQSGRPLQGQVQAATEI